MGAGHPRISRLTARKTPPTRSGQIPKRCGRVADWPACALRGWLRLHQPEAGGTLNSGPPDVAAAAGWAGAAGTALGLGLMAVDRVGRNRHGADPLILSRGSRRCRGLGPLGPSHADERSLTFRVTADGLRLGQATGSHSRDTADQLRR